MLMLKRAVEAAANFAGYEIRRKGNWEAPPPAATPAIRFVSHRYATADKSPSEIAIIKANVEAYASTVGWFHSFDFGHGVIAKGAATAEAIAKRLVSLGLDTAVNGCKNPRKNGGKLWKASAGS
jgi:hypothetical protein